MNERAKQLLQTVFGFSDFRGRQADIVEAAIRGEDVLVLMPTGGGKSLCYQIPALVRPGTAIVISPLIALMQDQVAALLQFGVRAAYLSSTLAPAEAQAIESQFLSGSLDLLYLAPERAITPRMQQLLARVPLSLLAIDEAHCVSHWGHDFRSDYLQITQLRERFPQVPCMALTATADERTRADIRQQLRLEAAREFVASFDRPNLFYRISSRRNAREQLLDFMRREHKGDAGVVYCATRNRVDQTAAWLSEQGVLALPYHAGLPPEQRELHQRRFLREEGIVMVATIAFGMGIDKSNVRFVAHLDLPKNLEAYYQETGRAGRDGLPADAWLVYGLQDAIRMRQMVQASDAPDWYKAEELRRINAMLAFCEQAGCRRQALLGYFGEQRPEPCGNCDTCVEPVATWDATEASRMALSAVFRTGMRYGVEYLIDVLMGKADDRVKERGHDHLPLFGIGQSIGTTTWRSVFRQLIAQGLLTVEVGTGSVQLHERCRPILRGEQTLFLRRDRAPTPAAAAPRREQVALHPDDEPLWQALRARRRQLAEEQGVPPYVICHDSTLRQIVEDRPASLHEMAQISGMGANKLARYGDILLQVMKAHESHPA